jgi:predicted O-methyltransferase YrrM
MSSGSGDQDRWTAVDHYLVDRLIIPDPARDAAEASDAAGLPRHEVSPPQGKLLHLLARMAGAKAILELGTLGGYSTIWLARALPPDGRVVTLEANREYAAAAQANLDRAGVGDRVDLRVGPALDALPHLRGPFDLIFIDADKRSNPDYLVWALKLARPGAVIVADNTVRAGAVLDPESPDPSVKGVRRFIDMVAEDPRLDATAIQTVGAKGWDGFVLALVVAGPAA